MARASRINGSLVEIGIVKGTAVVHKDGVLIAPDNYNKILPGKVLALAFMLNDKFVFQNNDNEEKVYQYLGLRRTSNAAWTSTFERKIAENTLELACTGKLSAYLQAI